MKKRTYRGVSIANGKTFAAVFLATESSLHSVFSLRILVFSFCEERHIVQAHST